MGVLKCPALNVYEYVMPKKPKHTYKFGITPLANEEKRRVKKSTQLFIANYQSSLSHKPPKTCRRLQTLYFLSHSSGQLSLEVAMFVCFHQLGPTGPSWSVSRHVQMFVCVSAPSGAVFFKASHWPGDHMISSRSLIGPPSFGNLETWKLGNSETQKLLVCV